MNSKFSDSDFIGAQNTILLPLGSTPIQIIQAARTLAKGRGLRLDDQAKVIAFDAKDVEHNQFLPTVEKRLQHVKLLSNEVVRGSIGDKQSRQKTEKKGLLWVTQPSFWKDPGVSGENVGVGGEPALGHALFMLNQNAFDSRLDSCLRDCHDYQKRIIAATGKKSIHERPATQAVILANLTGGTGNGSFPEVLHMLADKATQLKMELQIVPIFLLIGTIDPGDRRTAAKNQLMALHNILTRFNGKFKDLHHTNGDFRLLCEPPIFISNANNYGNIARFARLKTLTANLLHLLSDTPLGAQLRQEAVNLKNHGLKDENGASKCGATIGLAAINFNKTKLINFTAYQFSFDFAKSLLKTTDTLEPVKNAAMLASTLQLRETYIDNSAAQRILRLSDKGGVNAKDRATSIFRQRAGNRMGFKGCTNIYQAARYTLEQVIPKQLVHAIDAETEPFADERDEALQGQVDCYFHDRLGISKACTFLEHFNKLIAGYENRNKDELAQLRKHNSVIRLAVAACEKVYHRLCSKNWLRRLISFSDKALLKHEYPQHVEVLIGNELEIAARKVLEKKLFPTIRKALSGQQERVNRTEAGIINTCDHLGYDANRLRNLSDDFYVPCGKELAGPKFMQEQLDEVYASEGGIDKTNMRIFDAFMGKYSSLDVFGQLSSQEFEDFITDFCRHISKHHLWQLNVMDVFNETVPDEQQQHELVNHIIQQSDGKVKVSGEYDVHIPRWKCVCGPDSNAVDWAVKVANDIDRRGGDWRPFVIKGLSGLLFLQYRTRLSMPQLIEDTKNLYTPPHDPRQLVEIGENPVISTTPIVGCSDDDRDTVITEGIVVKLVVKGKAGYELVGAHDEPLSLGSNLADIRRYLAKNHGSVVYLHREFAAALAKGGKDFISRIELLAQNADPDSNMLTSQLGKDPFQRALTVAAALYPHVSRLPLNGSSHED